MSIKQRRSDISTTATDGFQSGVAKRALGKDEGCTLLTETCAKLPHYRASGGISRVAILAYAAFFASRA
jgi:hypothetical protein